MIARKQILKEVINIREDFRYNVSDMTNERREELIRRNVIFDTVAPNLVDRFLIGWENDDYRNKIKEQMSAEGATFEEIRDPSYYGHYLYNK